MPDDNWESASGVWESRSHMIELEHKKIKLLERMGEALVEKRHDKLVLLGLEAPEGAWSINQAKSFREAYTQAVKEGHQSFVFPSASNGVEYEVHHAYYLLRVLSRKFSAGWRAAAYLSALTPPPVINKEEKPE